MRPQAGAAFELDGVGVELTRDARVSALAGVDLCVAAGERMALVGPSGAGKTTLLRLLGASLRASSGRVRVDGRDLSQAGAGAIRRLRAQFGFVHQDHCLVPSLRVSQNVLAGRLGQQGFFAGLRSMLTPSRAQLEGVHALLEGLGVGEKLFQRADRLSGGEAQRVAIARALMQEPRALLADEPVASVDPTRSRDLLERLLEVTAARGSTLVASLHDVELARALFPRIVGLRAGRVVFDAAPADLDAADFSRLYELEGTPRA